MKKLLIILLALAAAVSGGTPHRYYLKRNTLAKPVVILTFDDETISQWDNVRPVLRAAGFNGVFFITGWQTARGRSAAYLMPTMTVEQMKILQSEGDDICDHSYTHIAPPPFTDSTVFLNDVLINRNFLKASGFYGYDIHAWVGGSSRTGIANYFDTSGLTFSARKTYTPAGVNTLVGNDPVTVDRYLEYSLYGDTTALLSNHLSWIDSMCIKLPLQYTYLFHSVDSTRHETGNVPQDYFNAIIAKLKQKSDSGLIDVKTYRQYYGAYVKINNKNIKSLVNDTVTITGYGFHKTPLSVSVGTIVRSSPESLFVKMPASKYSGTFTVTNADTQYASISISVVDSIKSGYTTIRVINTDSGTCNDSNFLQQVTLDTVRTMDVPENIKVVKNGVPLSRFVEYDTLNKRAYVYYNRNPNVSDTIYITASYYVNKPLNREVFTNSRVKYLWDFNDNYRINGTTQELVRGYGGVLMPETYIDSSGLFGGAAQFKDSLATHYKKNISTGAMSELTNTSIEMLVKPRLTAGNSYHIMSARDDGSNAYSYSVYTFSNFYRDPAIFSNGSYLNSQFSLTPNLWTHIVFTINSSNQGNIFLNGSLTGAADRPVTIPTLYRTSFSIGGNSAGHEFIAATNTLNGLLDYYMVYDTAKTLQYSADRRTSIVNPSSFYSVGTYDVVPLKLSTGSKWSAYKSAYRSAFKPAFK